MDDPQHQPAFEAPSVEELVPLFPSYEIGGFIAAGGMGAVYYARQKSLDRPVAIKILPREFGSDAQFRQSFEAEAKAMAKLNHPNLIAVYDFGDIDGMLFIVMEFVEGKSVHHSAHGIAIKQKEAAHVVSGICRGLAHAHQGGILHRDIKPANILLTSKAQAKIGDFGLARPVAHEHNPDEIIFGTPGYTAPEVLNNPHAVDQRTDIYAVGVILYELLTGRLPGDPWQPPSALAQTNIGFDAIVRRATHPSPELRYTDANELADELDALTKKLEGGVLRQATFVTPGAPNRPSPTTTAGIDRPSLASAQKSSFPVWAVILLLAGFAGVFGFIALNGNDSPKPKPVVNTPDPKPKPNKKPNKKPKPKPVVDRDKPNRDKDKDKPKDPEPVPVDSGPAPAETPGEALARLQSKLRSGDLSEMPPGAAKRGDFHYFLVEEPLGWIDAARFAEDHGGQLAALPSADDLDWIAEQFKTTSPVWIGLSDSGTEKAWFWTNGAKPGTDFWAPNQPNNTASEEDGEDFAALLPGVSKLDDLPGSIKNPFLIQWHAEGANSGTFSQQLRRTGAALKARRGPAFPAGTRNIGGSRFLLLAQSGTWDQASAFAIASGGHLAVPSNEAEAAWITDTLRATLGPAQACWIGGRRSSSKFEFVTGEKFEFVEWAPEQPGDGQRLKVSRSGGESGAFGYHAAEADDLARYLLIEWSAPSHRNMPSGDEKSMPDQAVEWLAAYRQQTYDRNKTKYERFRRRWDGNIDDFIDDVNSEIDTARKIEIKLLQKFAENHLKTIKENGRIPNDLPAGTPRGVSEIHKEALAEQKEIWQDFKEDFEGMYNKYLEDTLDQADVFDRKGDDDGADFMLREHTATNEDEDRMHAILRGEFPPVPDPAKEEANKDEGPGQDKGKGKGQDK